MEAVSLLLHTPNLLPSLSPARVSTLADVLVGCFEAACQATVALSALPAKKKESEVARLADNKEGESKTCCTLVATLFYLPCVCVCFSRSLAHGGVRLQQ